MKLGIVLASLPLFSFMKYLYLSIFPVHDFPSRNSCGVLENTNPFFFIIINICGQYFLLFLVICYPSICCFLYMFWYIRMKFLWLKIHMIIRNMLSLNGNYENIPSICIKLLSSCNPICNICIKFTSAVRNYMYLVMTEYIHFRNLSFNTFIFHWDGSFPQHMDFLTNDCDYENDGGNIDNGINNDKIVIMIRIIIITISDTSIKWY